MAKKLIVSAFTRDNFVRRRSVGNEYDPESLLTGGEVLQGLDYGDNRLYYDKEQYERIVSGAVPPQDVALIAPRVRGHRAFA